MLNKLNYCALIIEDEVEVNKKIAHYLEQYFDTVYSAFNAEEGIEIYRSKKVEVLFVDINLPQMNGIELVKKIRKFDFNTKVVMLTAKSDTQTLLQANELKLTKYLIKPLTRASLQDTIKALEHELKCFQTSKIQLTPLSSDFYWNQTTKELYYYNQVVRLTTLEKELLELFLNNKNLIMSFETITQKLWKHDEEDKRITLRTLVKKLRKKLPNSFIQSVHGIGYKATL